MKESKELSKKDATMHKAALIDIIKMLTVIELEVMNNQHVIADNIMDCKKSLLEITGHLDLYINVEEN